MKEDLADDLRLATVDRASVCIQRAIRGHAARKVYQAKQEEEARKRREKEEKKRQELARQQRELEQKQREIEREKQRELEREKARKDAVLAASGGEETKPQRQKETSPTEPSVSLARQTKQISCFVQPMAILPTVSYSTLSA